MTRAASEGTPSARGHRHTAKDPFTAESEAASSARKNLLLRFPKKNVKCVATRGPRASMILVKLGGSVLTDKARLRTPRRAAIARLAKELADASESLVVVHGAGSYGHILARRHKLHEAFLGKDQLAVGAVVQRDVRALNGLVLNALLDAGLAPVSLAPSALLAFADGEVVSFDWKVFRDYVVLGLTPVTFGDVVRDRTRGLAICSGDVLMLELAKAFRPTRAIFVADVDGLYTADPKRSRAATRLDAIRAADLDGIDFTPARSPDVTGSIEGKVRRMLEIAAHAGETMIVNGNVKNRVRDAVRGRPVVGTHVVGGP